LLLFFAVLLPFVVNKDYHKLLVQVNSQFGGRLLKVNSGIDYQMI